MGGAFGDRVYGSESRPVLPTLARGAARGSLGRDEAPVCQPQASQPLPAKVSCCPLLLFQRKERKHPSSRDLCPEMSWGMWETFTLH